MNADQDVLIQNNKIADIEADAEVFLGETDPTLFDMVAMGGDPRTILNKLGTGSRLLNKQWVNIGG